MPYFLNGQQLEPGQGFTHNGISYPSNWPDLATEEERQNIGITFVETPDFDNRFYYLDESGTVHARNVDDIRGFWIGLVNKTARANLEVTDWMVIREADNGTPMPDKWRILREAIRTAAGEKVTAIEQTADTAELAAYITGADYPAWPADPYAPEPVTEDPEIGR